MTTLRLHRSVDIAASWITLRRVRAHAILLALCFWGVGIADFASPGVFDRAGNLKYQDFIQFPVAARTIAQGQADRLYDDQTLADGIRALVGRDTKIHLQYLYGPQVALPFLCIANLPFLAQAEIWATLGLLMYFGCVSFIWRSCAALSKYRSLVAVCAVAYPPLFHFFVRGQLSAVVLACFTAAYLAFLSGHDWLAGITLGLLVFKPQFLVALPIMLFLAQAWRTVAGLAICASMQLALTRLYFGPRVMHEYFQMLLHSARRPGSAELTFSPIQMHSLRAFWTLLIPSSGVVWALYIVSSLVVIGIAASVWKSSSPLSLRFSALLIAAVLVNPHIYIYDLLALAPAFLLLADWVLNHREHSFAAAVRVLLYLAFVLPFIGPLSRWTHLQLSVPAFALLLWLLWRISAALGNAMPEALASCESRVV